jgi:hypothetical protein
MASILLAEDDDKLRPSSNTASSPERFLCARDGCGQEVTESHGWTALATS